MDRQTKRPDLSKTSPVHLLVMGTSATLHLQKLMVGFENKLIIDTIETLPAVLEDRATKALIVMPVAPARATLRESLLAGSAPADAIGLYVDKTQAVLRAAYKMRRSLIIVDAEALEHAEHGLLVALTQRFGLALAEPAPRATLDADDKRRPTDMLDLLAQSALAASPEAASLADEIEAMHTGPVGARDVALQDLESAFADWQIQRDVHAQVKDLAAARNTQQDLDAEIANANNLTLERDLLRTQIERLLDKADRQEAALRQELTATESLIAERNLLRTQTARLLDEAAEAWRSVRALDASEKASLAQSALLRENTGLLADHLGQQVADHRAMICASEMQHRIWAAERQSLLDRVFGMEAAANAQAQAAAAAHQAVAQLEEHNAQLTARLDQMHASSSWRLTQPMRALRRALPLPPASEG